MYSVGTYTAELYVARYILLGSNSCRLKLEEEGEKVAHLEPENHKRMKECRRLQKVPEHATAHCDGDVSLRWHLDTHTLSWCFRLIMSVGVNFKQ